LPVVRSGQSPPAPAWLEDTSGLSLNARENAVVSRGPVDALGGAQRTEQIGLGFAGKQIGKAGEAIPDMTTRARRAMLHDACKAAPR